MNRHIVAFLFIFFVIIAVVLYVRQNFHADDIFEKSYFTLVSEQENTPENLQLLYKKGFSSLATTSLLSIIEKNPYCHSDAHELGKLIYTRTNQNLPLSFDVCRDTCFDGCYHGTLMEAFRPDGVLPDETGHPTVNDFKTQAHEICEKGKNYQAIDECAHAIGHGILVSTNSIERSLELCKVFEIRGLEYYCTTGVFMQRDIDMGENDMTHEDFTFPCSQYEGLYDVPCWRYKTARLFSIYDSAEEVAKECKKLTPQARLGCFHGLGNAKYSEIISDPSYLSKLCMLSGNDNDRLGCIDGVMENLSALSKEKALLSCMSLPTVELQDFCNSIHGKENALERATLPLYF